MPHSVVLYCEPERDLLRRETLGDSLEWMTLQIFKDGDKFSFEDIYRRSAYPFTISPLFGKYTRRSDSRIIHRRHSQPGFSNSRILEAGTSCRLRITFLQDHLFPLVQQYLAEHQHQLPLNGSCLKVTYLLCAPEGEDEWCDGLPYEQLWENASRTRKTIILQFVTPTAFWRDGTFLPLPDPVLVFNNYWDLWHDYAPFPLSREFHKAIQGQIGVKDMKISLAKRDLGLHKQSGFTGWCTFALEGRQPERSIREFNLLADFSYYCASGVHTTRGMGVTKRLK